MYSKSSSAIQLVQGRLGHVRPCFRRPGGLHNEVYLCCFLWFFLGRPTKGQVVYSWPLPFLVPVRQISRLLYLLFL